MDNIIINPENYQSDYIKFLNECFEGWGKETEYNWAFNRTVGEHPADTIIIKDEDGDVIAGSGLTYRKVKAQDEQDIDIAIMTGSWTLPKARGKGCFSKIIAVSKEVAGKKGVPYLTAFVTESNASFRRLKDAGSLLVPSFHLFSPEEQYADAGLEKVSLVEDVEGHIVNIYNSLQNSSHANVSFSYTIDEFKKQYIDRPKGIQVLSIGAEYVVVEETYNAVKVLLLTFSQISTLDAILKPLVNWSLGNKSKRVLLFTTKEEVKSICENAGFKNLPGYFTILSTTGNANTNADDTLLQIHINNGDKM